MAIVEPGKGRAVVEQGGAGLRITVPAKPRFFVTLFLAFWLMGWAVGEFMVSSELLSGRYRSGGQSIVMIAWLGAWTLGGAWLAGMLLWNIAGKEIIELNSATLKRRKEIPVFSRSKEFAVARIANLRPAPASSAPLWYHQRNMSFLTFNEGTISFDYGRDTHHLASGLDEADAKYVIGEMCTRVKSLCPGSGGEAERAIY